MTKSKILIIVLIPVCIIAAISIWFFVRYNQPKNQNNISSNQVQTPGESVGAASSTQTSQTTTSTLKLYRNEQWGFEFWYPEGWEWGENTWGSPYSKFNLTLVKINGKRTSDDFGLNITTPEFIANSYRPIRDKEKSISVDAINSLEYKYTHDVSYTDIIIPISATTSIIFGHLDLDHPQEFDYIISTFKVYKR